MALPRWMYLTGTIIAGLVVFLALVNILALIPEGANPTGTYPGQPLWLAVSGFAGGVGLYFWGRWEATC
jgi:hypothetical protein